MTAAGADSTGRNVPSPSGALSLKLKILCPNPYVYFPGTLFVGYSECDASSWLPLDEGMSSIYHNNRQVLSPHRC